MAAGVLSAIGSGAPGLAPVASAVNTVVSDLAGALGGGGAPATATAPAAAGPTSAAAPAAAPTSSAAPNLVPGGSRSIFTCVKTFFADAELLSSPAVLKRAPSQEEIMRILGEHNVRVLGDL